MGIRSCVVLGCIATMLTGGCAREASVAATSSAASESQESGKAATLEISGRIPLEGVEGRIDHMAFDEKGSRLYVAALGNNTVEVIDVETGKRVGSIKGVAEPQGIAVVADSQRVVVASGSDGKCRIFDKSWKLVGQIDNLEDADNARYDARGKQVLVGYGSGALAVIDPQAGVKVDEIKLDGHPESFQIEGKGRRVFVNVPGAGHVAVVDLEKRAVIGKWPVREAGGNFPMALDEADHRLFIGCRRPAKLIVIDTESGKSVGAVEIVSDTDDIFYDAANHQLYVSGGGGKVSVIQQDSPDKYTLAATIATAAGRAHRVSFPGAILFTWGCRIGGRKGRN